MASPIPQVGGVPTDDPPGGCEHDGAFFAAIGEDFDDLSRRRGIVNADVLDAWFSPAPAVVSTLEKHLEWIVRTSPPTDCGGLVRAIAAARSVSPECILAPPWAVSLPAQIAAFGTKSRRAGVLKPTPLSCSLPR